MTKKNARSNLSQLKDLVSYLGSIQGDLSNISAPPFVLAPKSAIEIPSCWASCHDLFLQPASEPNPERRALLVAKNYLCSLRQLVDEGSGNEAKKPLNPFLGELFLAKFEPRDGSVTQLVAEQVSHHPPVTACCLYNKQHGISSSGFVAQETSFSPTSGVTVRQAGYAVVTDERHSEKHLMTMPTLLVKGLAMGQPYPELQGPCYISSSSGFITKIDLSGRDKLGLGSKNKVTAEVHQSSNMKTPLYRIAGQWSGQLSVQDTHGNVIEEFNVDDVPLTPLTVESTDKQSPWESRRAWSKVIQGIHEGHVEKINNHKNALEVSQRERRAEEDQNGGQWEGLFFSRSMSHDDGGTKQLLARVVGGLEDEFDTARTDGVWEFIGVEDAESVMGMLSQSSFP